MAHLINRRGILGAAGVALASGAAKASPFHARHGRKGAGGGGGGEFTNPSGVSGFTRASVPNALAAITAFNAGTSDIKLAMIGDSNLAGVGAGESGPGSATNIRMHDPARKLRDRLRAAGIAATDDSWWGFGNFDMSYFPLTEPRLTHSTSDPGPPAVGWSFAAPDGPCIGGLGLYANDTTGTATWQCLDTQTHMNIEVECSPGFGILEYSVDGGAFVGTIDLSTGTPGLQTRTVSLGSEGVHSVTFRAQVVNNRVVFFHIDFFNVNVRRVRIWPWIYSGGTLLNLETTPPTDYDAQGAHLAIINNWINDRGGPFPGTVTTTVVNKLKAANCDVLLENPVPTTPADTFAAAGLSLAATLGVPYNDMTWEYSVSGWSNHTPSFGILGDKHSTDAGYEKRTDYTWAVVRQLFGV